MVTGHSFNTNYFFHLNPSNKFLNSFIMKLPQRIHVEVTYRVNKQNYSLIFFKRKEFKTTDTELIAIAAPATHGAKRPAIAIGILMEL